MSTSNDFQTALEAHQKGQFDVAISAYKALLKQGPSLQLLYMLAAAYFQTGQLKLARENLDEFMRHETGNADAWNLLGNVLQDLGELTDAIKAYLHAIQANGSYSMAYNNLGTVYRQLRDHPKAIHSFHQAIAIKSNYFEAINNIGNVYFDQEDFQQAIKYYEQALFVNPAYGPSHLNRGLSYQKMGRLNEALKCYEDLLATNPNEVSVLWLYWLSLPANYASNEDIKKWRDRYSLGLKQVLASVQTATPEQIQQHYRGLGMIAPFYLGYQGMDDYQLQKEFGELSEIVAKKMYPQWVIEKKPLGHDKMRVGFISPHIYRHTVAKLFFGWLKYLDKNKFDAYVYHVGDREHAEVNQAWAKEAKAFRRLNGVASEMAETIVADELDVLIYLDLGMFPKINQLAALRLAPVQAVTWGHPVTSGFKTIDYFLTSKLMEVTNPHYTEKLVALPRLSICYEQPPVVTAHKKRSDFSLNEKDCVYFCCQFLSKYLVSYDWVFAKIAASVPQAKFVFIQNGDNVSQQIFKERLHRVFAEYQLNYEDHVVFVSYLSSGDYQDFNRLADVFLDSIIWSGGNTSLEALATDLPLVTCRGPYMRSNHTSAILEQLGLLELIASDADGYVDLAIRLGQDEAYRQKMRQFINENKSKVFGDMAVVRDLEQFIENSVKSF